MTLVWLAAILAVLVTAFVYGWWSIDDFTRRAMRQIALYQHERDPAEDQAWAEFLAEARLREQAIDDAMDANGAVDRLIALLDGPPKLEVVA